MSIVDYFGGNKLFELKYNQYQAEFAQLGQQRTDTASDTLGKVSALRHMVTFNQLLANGAAVSNLTGFSDDELSMINPDGRLEPLVVAKIPQRSAPLIFSSNNMWAPNQGTLQWLSEQLWDYYQSLYGDYGDHQASLDELENTAGSSRKILVEWIKLDDKVSDALSQETKRLAHIEGLSTRLFQDWQKRYCIMDRDWPMAVAVQMQLYKRAQHLVGLISLLERQALKLDLEKADATLKGTAFVAPPPDDAAMDLMFPTGIVPSGFSGSALLRAFMAAKNDQFWQENRTLNSNITTTFHNETPHPWKLTKRYSGKAASEAQTLLVIQPNQSIAHTEGAETSLVFEQVFDAGLGDDRPVLAFYTVGWVQNADAHLTYDRGLAPVRFD